MAQDGGSTSRRGRRTRWLVGAGSVGRRISQPQLWLTLQHLAPPLVFLLRDLARGVPAPQRVESASSSALLLGLPTEVVRHNSIIGRITPMIKAPHNASIESEESPAASPEVGLGRWLGNISSSVLTR